MLAPGDPAPDIIFSNERFFQWIGTDEDSDVVAFQFQLVEVSEDYFLTGVDPGDESHVLEFINPPFGSWSERRTDNFFTAVQTKLNNADT